MIDGLKPYPTYKNSGLPWIGEIPSHWDLQRARWLFRRMDRPVRDIDEVVTCFRDGTVTLRKNRRLRGFTESLKEIGYQGIRRGDLVIHAMDAFAGAVGVSDSDGKGTPVYSVCEPASSANAHYYAHVVGEMARSQWILALATGIRERSTDFRFEGFASQMVPLPPLAEQKAIVRFLGHAGRQIQRYIRAKKKLIALLNEQKQAIVHSAVTRGLNSTVPLKATGNSWFPQIPEAWEVLPMRRIIWRAVDGPHHSPQYIDHGVPFISARNIKQDRWSLDDAKFISEDDYREFSKRIVPERGDVLYTKGGTTGVARAVDLDFAFQVWVHVAVLKLRRDKVLPTYLATALNTTRCYEQSQLFTRGATNQDLGLSRMKDIVLPVPPLSEQEAIVAFVTEMSAGLVHAINRADREIELLREYRIRLIAYVVAGTLDVREAAARLPGESESDPMDDEVTDVNAEDDVEELVEGAQV